MENPGRIDHLHRLAGRNRSRGNEGVAVTVARTKGSIGYVEYAYATQNRLTATRLINRADKAVAPGITSFAAAASNANWEASPGFGVILTDESGAESWPITGATFVLMHKQPPDPVAASEALKFFNWAYASGGKMAEELRLHPDAGERDRRGAEALGFRDQGRGRQAVVRHCEVNAGGLAPARFASGATR